MVRLNFSVRNGKRWNPHAIITLVSFSRPAELFRSSWPVMVKKSCDGNAGFSCEKLLERSAFLEAISLERVNLERDDTLSPQRFLYSRLHSAASFLWRQGFVSLPRQFYFDFVRVIGSHRERLRVISTARLSMSPCLHLPPIYVVVYNDPQGDLILWLASRLDAFSAYPYQTRLPGGAPGGTTGRPEVCPSRSSRTSDRATQISDAHNR